MTDSFKSSSSINLCELVVGGGVVGAEDAGSAEVVGAGYLEFEDTVGERENMKVEVGKMSAAKVPLLASVEAVAPAKA